MTVRRGGLLGGEPLRVVVFGGGTGLSTFLRGLMTIRPRVDVTAIIAATDDGGSTGVLRRVLGGPAVGDARACLSAVAGEPGWEALLEHRFKQSRTLRGHPAGNLLLAAALERTGTFSEALDTVSRLVGARCRLLPATNDSATLVARLADGRVLEGESVLASVVGPIERIGLRPEIVAPGPGVLDALAEAHLIVLGPGSLFTSVLAATLAAGVARAIARSAAPCLFIQNLTTQRGETDDMGAADHLRAVQTQLGAETIDLVLAHRWNGPPPSQGVTIDTRAIEALGVRALVADLAVDHGRGRLHDPKRLAAAIIRAARSAGSSPIRSFG